MTDCWDRIEWRILGCTWLPQRAVVRLHDAFCWVQRVRFAHHNAQVLADMEYRFGCVLTWVTKRMSKAYYTPEAMAVEVAEFLNEERDEAAAEALEPLTHARPASEWTQDDGPVLWWRKQREYEGNNEGEVTVDPLPYFGPYTEQAVLSGYTHWTFLPDSITFEGDDV